MLLIAVVIIVIIATIVASARYGKGDGPITTAFVGAGAIVVLVLALLAFFLTNSFPASVSETVTTNQNVTNVENTTKLVQNGKLIVPREAVIITTEEGPSDKILVSSLSLVDSDENLFVTEVTLTKNLFISPFGSDITVRTLYWNLEE
jgi:hypothetical protein